MRVNLNNFQLQDQIKDKYESFEEIMIGLSALIALLPTMTYKEHDKLRYKHCHAVMRFNVPETPEPRRQDVGTAGEVYIPQGRRKVYAEWD
jgi:hypothetical protein